MNPNGQTEAEGIGHPNFWGFTPSIDLFDRLYVDGGESAPLFSDPSVDISAVDSTAHAVLRSGTVTKVLQTIPDATVANANGAQPAVLLRALQLQAGDPRHTLHTLAMLPRWRRAFCPSSAARGYVTLFTAESSLEGIARHLLLLAVAIDEGLDAPARARLFLALHSNVLLTWPQYHYLAARALPRVLLALAEDAGPLSVLVDLSWLKSREREDLEAIARDWVGATAPGASLRGAGPGATAAGSASPSGAVAETGRVVVPRILAQGLRTERQRWQRWQQHVEREATVAARAAPAVTSTATNTAASALGPVKQTAPSSAPARVAPVVASASASAANGGDDSDDAASVMARFGLDLGSGPGGAKKVKKPKAAAAKAPVSKSSASATAATADPALAAILASSGTGAVAAAAAAADPVAAFTVEAYPLNYPPPPPFTPDHSVSSAAAAAGAGSAPAASAAAVAGSSTPSAAALSLPRLRDHRLRAYLGQRYDARLNLYDFDLTFRLQGTCSIVHGWNYKRWRESGMAYEDDLPTKAAQTAWAGEVDSVTPQLQPAALVAAAPAATSSSAPLPAAAHAVPASTPAAAASGPAGGSTFSWSNPTLLSRREARDVSTAESRARYSGSGAAGGNGGGGAAGQRGRFFGSSVTHVRTLAADTDAGAEYRGGFGRMNNGLSAGAGTKGAGIGARAVAASVGLGRYSLPGYWGDILVGPWFGWGAEGLDRDAFEVKNKQHTRSVVVLAEHALTRHLHALDYGTFLAAPPTLRRAPIAAATAAASGAKPASATLEQVPEDEEEEEEEVASSSAPVNSANVPSSVPLYTVSAFSPAYAFGSLAFAGADVASSPVAAPAPVPASATAPASALTPAAVYGLGGRFGFGISYGHREFGLRVVLLPPGADALQRLAAHNAKAAARGDDTASVKFSRVVCGLDAAMRLKTTDLAPFCIPATTDTAATAGAAGATVLTVETLKHAPLSEPQRAAYLANVSAMAAGQGFSRWDAPTQPTAAPATVVLERAAAVPRFLDSGGAADTEADTDAEEAATAAAGKSDRATLAAAVRMRAGHATKDPLLSVAEETVAAEAVESLSRPLTVTFALPAGAPAATGTVRVQPPLHWLPLRMPLRLFASHGRRSIDHALTSLDAAAVTAGDTEAAYASLPDQRARASFVFTGERAPAAATAAPVPVQQQAAPAEQTPAAAAAAGSAGSLPTRAVQRAAVAAMRAEKLSTKERPLVKEHVSEPEQGTEPANEQGSAENAE